MAWRVSKTPLRTQRLKCLVRNSCTPLHRNVRTYQPDDVFRTVLGSGKTQPTTRSTRTTAAVPLRNGMWAPFEERAAIFSRIGTDSTIIVPRDSWCESEIITIHFAHKLNHWPSLRAYRFLIPGWNRQCILFCHNTFHPERGVLLTSNSDIQLFPVSADAVIEIHQGREQMGCFYFSTLFYNSNVVWIMDCSSLQCQRITMHKNLVTSVMLSSLMQLIDHCVLTLPEVTQRQILYERNNVVRLNNFPTCPSTTSAPSSIDFPWK